MFTIHFSLIFIQFQRKEKNEQIILNKTEKQKSFVVATVSIIWLI